MAYTISQQLESQNQPETRTQQVRQKQYAQSIKSQEQQSQQQQDLQIQAQRLQDTDFKDITSIKEYEGKYNNLSPELKPYFISPDSLKQSNLQDIQNQINDYKSKIESVTKERNLEADQQVDIYGTPHHKPDYDKVNDLSADINRLQNSINALENSKVRIQSGETTAGEVINSVSSELQYQQGLQRAGRDNSQVIRDNASRIKSGELSPVYNSSGQFTGQIYKTSELPQELKGMKLTQDILDTYNNKVAYTNNLISSEVKSGQLTPFIDKSGKVGGYYKTSELPKELQGGELTQQEIEDYNLKLTNQSTSPWWATQKLTNEDIRSNLDKIAPLVKIYKQAGYSQPQAEALAKYSIETETTPTKITARGILVQENIQGYKWEHTLMNIQNSMQNKFNTYGKSNPIIKFIFTEEGLTGINPYSINPISLNPQLSPLGIAKARYPKIKNYAPNWYDLYPNLPKDFYSFKEINTKIGTNIFPTTVFGLGVYGALGAVGEAEAVSAKIASGIITTAFFGQTVYESRLAITPEEKLQTNAMGLLLGLGVATQLGEAGFVRFGKSTEILTKELNIEKNVRYKQLKAIESGANSDRAILNYKRGEFLSISKEEQGNIIKAIKDATGMNDLQVKKLIKSNGFYIQEIKVPSNVKSTEVIIKDLQRDLKVAKYKGNEGLLTKPNEYFKGGKISQEPQTYATIKKYGISREIQSELKQQQLAFEFTSYGNQKARNMVVKLINKDNAYALASIYEKVRFKPSAPKEELIFQQQQLIRLESSQQINLGNKIDITKFKSVSKALTELYPEGKARLTFEEALGRNSFIPEQKGYLKAMNNIDEELLSKLWEKVSKRSVGNLGEFDNIRIEFPRRVEVQKGIYVTDGNERLAIQIGSGRRGLQTKNPYGEIDYEILNKIQERARINQVKELKQQMNEAMNIKELESKRNNQALELENQQTKTIQQQSNKVDIASQVKAKTKLNIKRPSKEVSLEEPSSRVFVVERNINVNKIKIALASQFNLVSGNKSLEKLESNQLQKLNSKQVEKLQSTQRTSQLQKLITQQLYGNAFPPTTTIPRTPPPRPTKNPPIIPIELWEQVKKKSKKHKRKKQSEFSLAYQEDFTSKALGLSPMVVNRKDVAKIIKQIQGVNIRRGVIIR